MTSYIVKASMDILNILIEAESPDDAKAEVEEMLEDFALGLDADGFDIDAYEVSEYNEEDFE